LLKLNLFVEKLFKIVKLSKYLKKNNLKNIKNIALYLAKILLIKKFIN